MIFFFFCKQKTAYEMRISDWSSDVCSSDLLEDFLRIMEHRGRGIERQRPARHHLRIVPALALGIADRHHMVDRKSVVSGKSVSVRVDVGGRRIINKKQNENIDL